MNEYENVRRISYAGDGESDLVFVPVCPKCGRFVKADGSVSVNGLGDYVPRPNADCKHCGRVEMPFEGFF
jgi:hypothetical protein